MADVVKQVTAKLRTAKLVGANPPPGEILAALDRALQTRPAAESPAPRGVPAIPVPAAAAPAPPPASAEAELAAGLRAVVARDYAGAIAPLTAAAKASPHDARAYYLLAVARMQVGESAAAYQLFTGAAQGRTARRDQRRRTRVGAAAAHADGAEHPRALPRVVLGHLSLVISGQPACKSLSCAVRGPLMTNDK